jgi:hypothetical protein
VRTIISTVAIDIASMSIPIIPFVSAGTMPPAFGPSIFILCSLYGCITLDITQTFIECFNASIEFRCSEVVDRSYSILAKLLSPRTLARRQLIKKWIRLSSIWQL